MADWMWWIVYATLYLTIGFFVMWACVGITGEGDDTGFSRMVTFLWPVVLVILVVTLIGAIILDLAKKAVK